MFYIIPILGSNLKKQHDKPHKFILFGQMWKLQPHFLRKNNCIVKSEILQSTNLFKNL